MRRLAALALGALALGACGGTDGEAGSSLKPAPQVEAGAVVNQPTAEQLEFREQLLAQLRNGTYDCDCNGDERARERSSSSR